MPKIDFLGAQPHTTSAALPSTGTWREGTVVHNTGAYAEEDPTAWRCVQGGTFGTYAGVAKVQSNGTKVLTLDVANFRGLEVGTTIRYNSVDALIVARQGANQIVVDKTIAAAAAAFPTYEDPVFEVEGAFPADPG